MTCWVAGYLDVPEVDAVAATGEEHVARRMPGECPDPVGVLERVQGLPILQNEDICMGLPWCPRQ
jgi:hypothetical protein